MAAIAWDGKAAAAAEARRRLPALAREYFSAGRRLTARGTPTPEALHAFRLRTKRFRYTLEMFRAVYGDGLDEYLGCLRQVQTFLGDINDCATTRALVLEAMPSPSPLRRRIETALDARAGAISAEFLAWWRTEMKPAAREARWRAFLAQSKPARKRAPTAAPA